MSSNLKIKLHEDAENGKAFIGVTSVGKQALQKIEQTNPAFTGKPLSAIAKGIVSDVVFNLSYNCNLSDDVEECFQRMLEFGLDDVYVLWSKGWTSIVIARKIMKTLNLTPTASNPQESRSRKNEESLKVLSDADRKFLQGHTNNNAQLNAFEREFPKLKFKDTFFPKNPTYRATPDEIPLTAEDAETMIGSREDFLLMCLDALRSTRSIERVKSAEGEDVITAYT